MQEYEFKACNEAGRIVEGVEFDESEAALRKRLFERRLRPIRIAPKAGAPPTVEEALLRLLPVSQQQIAFFFEQTSAMLDSGVPLLEALQTVHEQISNRRLNEAVNHIVKRVESGSSLAAALESRRDIFSATSVRVVEAGEASGQIDLTLAHLAEMIEFELEMSSRVREATRYPKLVIGTLVVATLAMVSFIIPRFASMFQRSELELPLPTQALIGFHYILSEHWGLFLLAGLMSYIVYALLNSNAETALWIERIKLKIPIWGELRLKVEMSRVFKILSVLIESGVDILTSFQLAATVSNHKLVEQAFLDVRRKLEEGLSVSNSLKDIPLFPKISRRMIMLGDKSGRLSETFETISSIYEKECSAVIKRLSVYIEPILVVTIGFMILLFALGIFLPMWDFINVIRQ